MSWEGPETLKSWNLKNPENSQFPFRKFVKHGIFLNQNLKKILERFGENIACFAVRKSNLNPEKASKLGAKTLKIT